LNDVLLDTNVVSELRRARPHGAVVAWLRTIEESQLHLSAVTLYELQAGVEATRARDPDKAGEIERWVDRIVDTYRVIPIDAHIFRLTAKLLHARSQDLFEDALIAATALANGLTVVTRNRRDFAPFDVPTLDPFRA
jgi:toxin FitB